jgi:hypothetical protein
MRLSHLAVVALSMVRTAWCQDAPADGPTVGVILQFDNNNPGTAPIRAMEHEVEQLLKGSGVAVDWRLPNQEHGDEQASKWIVVKFKGKCRVEAFGDIDPEPVPTGERTLATTKLEKGHVLPFSQVQCNEVRSALAYLRPWADGRERQNAMGMALGRVIAHELYHILARTTTHAAHGLAQASQSLKDLVAKPGIAFGEEDLRAIREGVEGGGDLPVNGLIGIAK